ncbi:MAG: hypothetical protein Q9173_002134 [Seirophora scorigena]
MENLESPRPKSIPAVEIASTTGSSGALAPLPTAGALIGAPSKELWVVYNLMPIAGVLSMMLSLGGNIVPTDASGYEMKVPRFSYRGLVATRSSEEEDCWTTDEPDSQVFADMVERRAKDPRGDRKLVRVWLVRRVWLILVWWCENSGWMWIWYLTSAASSILENCTGVPFTEQWTLRLSRPPRVRISEDAPLVRQPKTTLVCGPTEDNHLLDRNSGKCGSAPAVEVFEEVPLVQRTASARLTVILDALKAGFNCKGQMIRDGNEPWSSSRMPFYVIISVEGISAWHAALRVFSKAITIGVHVFGTAIFASAQLVYLSIAVTVLYLVLGAGVFGRVIAMWMASEMMKTKPVLHRVVKSRGLAAEYIDRILDIDELVVKMMGHVIVNGRCIQMYNSWFQWSNWLGLLAGPYDIGKVTVIK